MINMYARKFVHIGLRSGKTVCINSKSLKNIYLWKMWLAQVTALD